MERVRIHHWIRTLSIYPLVYVCLTLQLFDGGNEPGSVKFPDLQGNYFDALATSE